MELNEYFKQYDNIDSKTFVDHSFMVSYQFNERIQGIADHFYQLGMDSVDTLEDERDDLLRSISLYEELIYKIDDLIDDDEKNTEIKKIIKRIQRILDN